MTPCYPLALVSRWLLLGSLLLITFQSAQVAALAQSVTATLSGTVTDANNAVVPGAHVTATNGATGFKREATTSGSGTFVIPLLPPSTYTVLVENQGFTPAEIKDVTLNVNDNVSLNIELKVGQVGATVDVKGDASLINESPAVGTTVDRQFVANLPINGRSFSSLVQLSPGVVLTKGSGQFSINGQRDNANYYTVDGVSANAGVTFSGAINQTASGSLPGTAVTGGTNNLVSVDALQEFKIQTSTYAAEFGRTPGGQVQIVTRAGTNKFSGTLFDYFRNNALDANDWFNNSLRLKRPPLRQNDFGFVLGGPLFLPRFGEGGRAFSNGKDKTFFFFSYEGLRLLQPRTRITEVPTLANRAAAPAGVKPFLNVFPLPNGPDLGTTGTAQFSASLSEPTNLNATSIRIDHTVNSKLTFFGRYNHAPSSIVQRGSLANSLANIERIYSKTQTLTFGSNQIINSKINNDVRFNYTKLSGFSNDSQDNLNGAVPIPDSLIFPPGISSLNGRLTLALLAGPTTTVQFGGNSDNLQRQINLVDNIAITTGGHQLKFGVDYRRLTPISSTVPYNLVVFFFGVPAAVAGTDSTAVLQSDPVTFLFNNFSAYGQDTWKINGRLTLTYGLRWELNPPTRGTDKQLYTLQGLNNVSTASLAPAGTPFYKTTYNNFAPRLGIAYQLSQAKGRETMLRGGFGLFYDLGYGLAGRLAGFPYARSRNTGSLSFPINFSQIQPAPVNLNQTGQQIQVYDPNLKLPLTYQWNLAVEQSLGVNQTISASYVGAIGRRLLRMENYVNANPTFQTISLIRNTATSDYNALQLRFQRRLSRGLQALASYTWSHSIDNASNEFGFIRGDKIDPNTDRGPSDFDVRHSLTAGVSYNLPTPFSNRFGKAVLGNWSIDGIFRARTATPLDITSSRNIGFGAVTLRPDLVAGVPLWITDPSVGGGRRINPAAFVIPTALPLRQGTLGRNALRGFPFTQVDLTLRRQFNLTERVNLQFRADFFNILNHPNFGDPTTTFTSGLFGKSTFMLNQSSTNVTAQGLSTLYQIGGPRSTQLSLKLSF